MKDRDWGYVVDILLICAIVYLAANDKDGWGWLLLFLILKN
jgi:hypothetical protein